MIFAKPFPTPKNQAVIIPTPQDVEMKWLPKRKKREEQKFNDSINRHIKYVIANLESGYTRFEMHCYDEKERAAVEERLKAAGWNVRWDQPWMVQLAPLDTQTTE